METLRFRDRSKPQLQWFETAAELANMGGIAGLRNLARAKANMGIRQFTDRLAAMIHDIEEALKAVDEGKRVLKGGACQEDRDPRAPRALRA